MKRGLCVLLCLLFLVLTACSDATVQPPPAEITDENTAEKPHQAQLQLLYNAADTFDPYTASTELNREICQLIYEPLLTVDSSFRPVLRLAQTATMSGKQCTVVLKSAKFSDGSAVTASDVAYSFRLAKASSRRYATQLATVSSATARDTKTVVFGFQHGDPYGRNLLNFPILKNGSAKRKDADGKLLPPIGCGRYAVGEGVLTQNPYYFGQKGTAQTVRLINAPDADSISHYVEIGATDAYFTDISDGKIVRMSGKRVEIPLNRLVYIGCNHKNKQLNAPELRYAISSALDRSALCRSSYYDNAVPATGFFHPNFAETAAVQNIKNQADLKIAVENLTKMGYNKQNSNGIYLSGKGTPLSFSLLVNAENESRVAAANRIAEQLKTAGIGITVVPKKYKEYVSALKTGAFQLYLAEIRLPLDMDLSDLVLPTGKSAYGLQTAPTESGDTKKDPTAASEKNNADSADKSAKETPSEKSAADIAEMLNGYYAGTYSVSDIAIQLLTELPVIPVCYRKGLLFYDPEMITPISASEEDYYRAKATGY